MINGVSNKCFLTNQNTPCIQVTLEQVVKERSVQANTSQVILKTLLFFLRKRLFQVCNF